MMRKKYFLLKHLKKKEETENKGWDHENNRFMQWNRRN